MILYARPKVKSTRNTPRPAARFGRGILPYVGQHDGRRPYTAEDLALAAQLFGQAEDDRERGRIARTAAHREADRMAEEAAWQASYENGHLPV
jgi:hypothetical protein